MQRKHRFRLKKNTDSTEWALYDTMLDFYKKYEKQELITLEVESQQIMTIPMMKGLKNKRRDVDNNDEENEFNCKLATSFQFSIHLRLESVTGDSDKRRYWYV